ncbi:glucosamine inositolphosphorylceramide transferase family protein [Phyllobacterium sp. K27]
MSTRLRIGIITDSFGRLQNWEIKLIKGILKCSEFDLTAIIETGPGAAREASFAGRFIDRLEQRIFVKQLHYPPQPFGNKQYRIPVPLRAGRDGLLDVNIDVAVRLTAKALPQACLGQIEFGEWSLDFVDNAANGHDWTGFWEVKERAALTLVQLVAHLNLEPQPLVIASARYNTKYSAALNGAFTKEKSVLLLLRELRRLAETRKLVTSSTMPPVKARTAPQLGDSMAYLGQLGRNICEKLAIRTRATVGLNARSWGVYMGDGSIENFAPDKAKPLKLADGMWAADPFLFRWQDQDYVFFECFPDNSQNAWISVARLSGTEAEFLGTCLRTSYHLSYPFIFNNGSDIYMIPETHQTDRVEIWRCTQFPLRWELHSTALEGKSPADTTMFKAKGQWWLLTSLSDHHTFMDHSSELYAFAVDGPDLKTVIPHKRNPVIIGSDIARNGGRVHIVGDRVFRPSQCNSHGVYGYGLNIQEITRLDAEDYAEETIKLVRPDFMNGIVGCHHLDTLGTRFVIDLCKSK